MLSKILGIIWIVFGVLWLIKPQILRNRLKKKMNRRIRRVVYGFMMIFGFLLIGSVIKARGLLPKIIGLAGIVLAIKAIILITSKTSERILDWWADKPLLFFRTAALLVLTIGLMLIFV
ncbi:MAG: hypothetical protein DRP85_08335 [Candidatus Makaraimicrobium thalassicum]|nr:MAG: hypothetical protein DRP85_08335 [Candidatus Omnitrophota bacterium]